MSSLEITFDAVDTIIVYKGNGVKHDFTENYASWGEEGSEE